jgi:YD repeat-containing protein
VKCTAAAAKVEVPAGGYTDLELVMPDGGKVDFDRTSAGTGFGDAVYTATNIAGAYAGATVAWNGDGWDLARRDGMTYVFGDVAGLQAIRDRFGNTIRFLHASGQSGNITQVVSASGRWMKLTYDGSNRVAQAEDNPDVPSAAPMSQAAWRPSPTLSDALRPTRTTPPTR